MRCGYLVMMTAVVWWIGGCASPGIPSHPVTLPLDHLLPAACREASVDLRRWPGIHRVVNAPAAEVFATARQLVLAQGYRVSAEEAKIGCLQTDYRPVRPSRWESFRSALGLQPALTSRSLVVQVTEEGRGSRVSVWGIARFGSFDLIAGHPSVMGQMHRLSRAIKTQYRKTWSTRRMP